MLFKQAKILNNVPKESDKKKTQIEMIKFKNLAIKIKILLDRLSTGVDMAEDRTNELEDKPIEFSYLNNQKEID